MDNSAINMPDLESSCVLLLKWMFLILGACRDTRRGTHVVSWSWLALTSPPHLVLCQEGVSQVFLEEKLQPPR